MEKKVFWNPKILKLNSEVWLALFFNLQVLSLLTIELNYQDKNNLQVRTNKDVSFNVS